MSCNSKSQLLRLCFRQLSCWVSQPQEQICHVLGCAHLHRNMMFTKWLFWLVFVGSELSKIREMSEGKWFRKVRILEPINTFKRSATLSKVRTSRKLSVIQNLHDLSNNRRKAYFRKWLFFLETTTSLEDEQVKKTKGVVIFLWETF